MSAFECYQQYIALKNHFNQPAYDYFKYNGKTNVGRSNFDVRKDRLFFEKLAKHKDPIGFLVANLVENNKAWIRDIVYSEQAAELYSQQQKRIQSLTYVFENDLARLDKNFSSNFDILNNKQPLLVKLYLQKEISLETLAIIIDMTKCISFFDKELEYDPTWGPLSIKIKKYIPFIQYDRKKYKKILVDKFKLEC